jgi:hypothetical protein
MSREKQLAPPLLGLCIATKIKMKKYPPQKMRMWAYESESLTRALLEPY